MKKREGVLIALVLADVALKAGARAALRYRTPPNAGAGPIRLGYVENGSGFGFDQTRLLAHYGIATSNGFIASILASFLVLAFAIVLWHKFEARPWIKTAAAAAFYLAIAVAALSFRDSTSLRFSPYVRGVLRSLGPLAVAIALYCTVSNLYYALLSLFFLAGTIGNCASLVLPPFTVIDYFGIFRPSLHAYVYANAADAYLIASGAMLLLLPAYFLVRSARRSAKRPASPA